MRRFLPLLLVATPAVAAEPAPPPRLLPDVSGFPAALKAALGDHFDYLGGEPGRSRGEVEMTGPHRFWFAKLRARRSGVYKLDYRVRLGTPVPNPTRPGDVAEEEEFTFFCGVAEPGTTRVFQPQEVRGATRPDVVVGDTLLLPVHTDPGRSNYRFAMERLDFPIGVLHALNAEGPQLRAAAKGETARVLASPGLAVAPARRMVIEPGQGRDASHWVHAKLRFTAPGTFDLVARLADEPAGRAGRMSFDALLRAEALVPIPPLSFRVVPRGQPVSVLLGQFMRTHPYRQGGSSGSGECLEYGTLEARVGDSVFLDCGISERPPARAPAHDAVVEKLPFRDVPHYTPR